jgi:hypothetical protein
MKHKPAFLLSLFFVLFPCFSQGQEFPFKAPFYVKDSVIYDQEDRVVKLWGVNYLAPFNHNFVNIEESGISHTATIDKDLDHFALLGIDFIRIHFYDREVTDALGNLVENEHLKVFDYLVDQAQKRGIFVMITATGWWNTVQNEVRMRKGYAYWDLTQQPNFGFSNYFAKHAILWHPEAIECQKRYLRSLFDRRNVYSGKRMGEYENIVVIELTNEPDYVYDENHLDNEPRMGSDLWREGAKPNHLRRQYEALAKAFPEETSRKDLMPQFRGDILSRYFSELWPIVDEFFGDRVLKSHIEYDFENPHIVKAFHDAKVDAVNVVSYLNAVGKFDGGNTDWANFLNNAGSWLETYQRRNWSGFPKIVYEYGASSSLDGYVIGAFGTAFRRADVQMAAFFTYTPCSVAAYNPGWLIHYLNMEHTPNKAAAFAAAGDIYRSEIPVDSLKRGGDQWTGTDFVITRKPSNVDFYNGKTFRYAASTARELGDVNQLETISGRGNSAVAESNGNGCYFLHKIDDKHWTLRLFANEKIVNDPAGAQTFRQMANRYMNIDDMPVVSRLLDQPIRFKFKIGKTTKYEPESATQPPKALDNGFWELRSGKYVIELE